jgi:hypothetical protein
MKMMLITFFDIKGSIHYEFFPQGQTVNKTYYTEIMKWLHEAVCRRDLNSAPTIGFSTMTKPQLTRCSVMQFLAQKSITEMEHPL